ncbi:MAG: hypothetical protein ACAF41_18855 [Leptolyngbya sp. BL-A-14]
MVGNSGLPVYHYYALLPLPTRSEAMIYAAMVHLMLRRLAPADSVTT